MSIVQDNERTALLAERMFDGRRWHAKKAVLVEAGRIGGLVEQGEVPQAIPVRRLPAGIFLAPGFIDLQVNGGGGVLFNDAPSAEAIGSIARAHRRFGTTALLPTFITDTREKTAVAIAATARIVNREGILGVHLEGPFINPARAGIHPRERIARAETGDLEWLRALADIGHSLVTLAPECVPEGFIRALVACGIRVAIGHSEASAETVARAVREGASAVTHLFNAMPPLRGRAPSVVGATFAEKRLTAGLIVDGFHVDPVSVRAAFATKGAEGIMLVTDAMPTVGAPSTRFELGDRLIALEGGRLAAADGTLAGAHLDMASAVRNAVTMCGVPLGDALQAATLTPARFLGLDGQCGVLKPGARADIIAMTDALEVVACWQAGAQQA